MRATFQRLVLLLLITVCMLLLLVLELRLAHAMTSEVYCSPGSTFTSPYAGSGRSLVYPWAVAVRNQHATQYNLNYRSEYGFYDVPLDHPLYGELEKFQLWGIVPEKCPHVIALDETLTRGELAMIIAKLGIYTKHIPGMVLPMTAPYEDVALTDEYAITLHTLQTYNIIDNGTTFRPDQVATKIEAITMLARLYRLSYNPSVRMPFQDVIDSWYTPGLKAAYSNGYLAPMPELEPAKKLDKETFFTLLAYWDAKDQIVIARGNTKKVDDRNMAVYGPRTRSEAKSTSTTTTSTKTTTSTTASNTLTIKNASKASSYITPGASAVTLWEARVTNGYTSTKRIDQMSFSVIGLLPPQSIRNIVLSAGDQRVSGILSNRSITFFDPIEIAGGETVTLRVQGDFPGAVTTANFSLSLGSRSDLMLLGGTQLAGSFPLSGPSMRFNNNGSAATITVQHVGSNQLTIQEQTQDVFLHTLRLSSSVPNSDLLITQMRLRIRGSIDEGVVTNIKASNHYNGQLLSTSARPVGDMITLNFASLPDGGIMLRDGKDALIDLSASVGNADGETLYLVIDEPSDIRAEDAEFGIVPVINSNPYNSSVSPLRILERVPFRPSDYYYNFD